jgi:sirohydrochlorin cobaltochelatase
MWRKIAAYREIGEEQEQSIPTPPSSRAQMSSGDRKVQTMTETAVLICGHGSRDPEAISEFELVAAAMRPRLPDFDFATGYLEFARPTIRDGLAELTAAGARQILAIPGMLFAASHVKNDLPREINSFMADNPGIDVRLARDLATDPKLSRAAADRIAAAADVTIARGETLLLVVGRGTNDPAANSNIPKLGRLLREEMGFGWAEVAFSGVAHPRVDAALTRAARLGFPRIILFPYFLVTGVLVKRIYAQTEEVARLFPEIEFLKALYLRDHPEVISTFWDRVDEVHRSSRR